ncbi:MAG TPA: hypothetical protein VEK57_27850 [Thermoanaerobaculia bacterium]|nr:hypothetical protein [Thermoanaerobaculia bacterium]
MSDSDNGAGISFADTIRRMNQLIGNGQQEKSAENFLHRPSNRAQGRFSGEGPGPTVYGG